MGHHAPPGRPRLRPVVRREPVREPHGGHRLEDLAMLSLFDAPHLEEIFEGYTEEHPLPGDWEQDLPAHLFFGLLAHVHLFGEAYVDQAISTAEAIIARADELGF